MEMAISFFLKKPILIFNEIPEKSNFLEEILGLNPIVLHGKIASLKQELEKLSSLKNA